MQDYILCVCDILYYTPITHRCQLKLVYPPCENPLQKNRYVNVSFSFETYLKNYIGNSEDTLITKTMINNYTKNDLLPSPIKKKYSKEHMILLIFIYYMKNFLSITDIRSLLHPMTEMFFDGKGEIDLEEIYQEIFDIQAEQSLSVAKDIVKKADVARETFAQVENEEQREYLKKYAYACLLSYDIYMKRQMLERLIDDNFSEKKEK